MTSSHRTLLVATVVCWAIVAASADNCPGIPEEYQTTCDCTNKPFTTLYCDTSTCGDGGCGPCAIDLLGNYCGSLGKQSCYISTVTYSCITGLNKGHATSSFWNSLKSDAPLVSSLSIQATPKVSAHK